MRPAFVFALLLLTFGAAVAAGEKTERFDRDPGWDGVRNRVKLPAIRKQQNFGFQTTNYAGLTPGEIGGVSTVPHRDAVVEPTDPLRGLGQQLEIRRRQRLRSVGAAQLLEGFAPRVTLERLAAGGKLVFRVAPHWLLSG